MKITFDTKTNTCKIGGKTFGIDCPNIREQDAMSYIREFLNNNTKLTDYEMDSMWMSYRYSIGSHTIATHMRASDIVKNCYGRMSKDRSIFTAYDMNREIEDKLRFGYPAFHFPITSLNKIYTSAIDVVCEFIEDYNIKSVDDFIKYRNVEIILTDNERGYKIEPQTWDEYIEDKLNMIFNGNNAPKTIEETEDGRFITSEQEKRINDLKNDLKYRPTKGRYFMSDIEDLFVWNDLVHIFDIEHHHKSVLTDGTEVEWFWSWVEKSEKREDGYYYKTFGYQKIRMPIDKWNGVNITWIPDDAIIKDLY